MSLRALPRTHPDWAPAPRFPPLVAGAETCPLAIAKAALVPGAAPTSFSTSFALPRPPRLPACTPVVKPLGGGLTVSAEESLLRISSVLITASCGASMLWSNRSSLLLGPSGGLVVPESPPLRRLSGVPLRDAERGSKRERNGVRRGLGRVCASRSASGVVSDFP